MIGILAIPERLKDMRDAVDESDIHYIKIGPFSPDEFLQNCQAVSAIDLKILIVDIEGTDGVSIVKGLRIFRAQRNTRIILIAPGRKPGDSTIAALLPLQIWDIVAPDVQNDDESEEEGNEDEREYRTKESFLTFLISQQIRTASSYGNVARWDVEVKQETTTTKQKPAKQHADPKTEKQQTIDQSLINFIEDIQLPPERVREVHIYRDRPLGSIVIGIAGATRRSGATYGAIQAAAWLAKVKKRVALVELQGEAESSLSLYQSGTSSQIENGFILEGISIYPDAKMEQLAKVFMDEFDFIVIDFGWLFDSKKRDQVNQEYLREFARAYIHIITMGSSVQDEEEALLALDYLLTLKWKQKVNFLVNFSTNDAFERISALFGKRQLRDLNVAFHQNDLMTDPFIPESESLQAILEAFVKKKKGFKLFRKG